MDRPVSMYNSRDEIVMLISQYGKYELQEENNQGMNAYAFKARHVPLNRDVFLKIYDASSERNDIFEEPRFLVEATNGTGGSAYLVNVLDAEKLSEDWVLVAMELVDGGSLMDAIEHGPLPLMDAINITKYILHGLSHLHNTYLVHRDIKPANIMLTTQNGRQHPKLGDFGSVARLANSDASVDASRHSALYVPPEGSQEPSQYGIQSDIYQVGLVMAELINGHLPYEEETYLDRQAKCELKEYSVSSLSDLSSCDACQVVNHSLARRTASRKILSFIPDQPYVNRTLKKIINTATHPDYSKRYSSAMDMCNELNCLNFPNWKISDNKYIASNWNSWDWCIEPTIKFSCTDFIIKKSRCGADAFRRWGIASSLDESFNKVLREG